jgi:N6-L-threonylcarbamoyladenine synthase
MGAADGGSRVVLAIETSCDDTCAAVVEEARIRSNVISSQAAAHERYGGVVPEVASRHHLELLTPVVDAALDEAGAELGDLDAIAVTRGPGLIGALLVGVSAAKALAAPARLPMVGVDHLHGHVAANFLEPDPLEPPFLCLIASGGHTLLAGVREPGGFEVLGETLDDAAGEALDKGARLLGLGYPGGPAIQREAERGDPEAFEFPVAMSRDPSLDFSFSGLKTALLYATRELSEEELAERRADLAASYQNAVVGQLVAKLRRALEREPWPAVALGGGVAANALLRERVGALCAERGLPLKLVPPELCTDNAAMIAAAAQRLEPTAYPGYLAWDAWV